jgi:hypothetical protein
MPVSMFAFFWGEDLSYALLAWVKRAPMWGVFYQMDAWLPQIYLIGRSPLQYVI